MELNPSSLPICFIGSSVTGHNFTLFTTITNVNCIVTQHQHKCKNKSTFSHDRHNLTNSSFGTLRVAYCNVGLKLSWINI